VPPDRPTDSGRPEVTVSTCRHCRRRIDWRTYGSENWEPDYDSTIDEATWRHANGYASCTVTHAAQPESPVPGSIDAAHLARQRDWSRETFGPALRTYGLLDHIRKELAEIEADPFDISEWIDVVILALDGAWRHGAEPQQIIDAIKAKQAKNETRSWPDWRTRPEDQAIEHDRNEASA
jgi:hypothetical protein